MNIPDEVYRKAYEAGEFDAADYKVIAEWARKEALREAAEIAMSNWEGTVNTQGMSYEDAAAWEQSENIAAAIRALAEGSQS